MKTLNQNLDAVGFINREKGHDGKIVKYRCGRDFLYYSLNYFYPDKFNQNLNNAIQLEKTRKLGIILPWWLMWTQLQFLYLPKFLSGLDLQLSINGKQIKTFFNFLKAISIPKKSNAHDKIKEIENAIDFGYASGIDISLDIGGFVDHVLFVYGYDENNLYVFDTHQVKKLEYEKILDGNKYYMKLPKSTILKRWSKFARVWIIKKK